MVWKERSEGCSSPGPWTVAPCLVKCHGVGMTRKDSCSVYDIFKPNNQDCGKCIPELSGTTFYQKPCHQGWLIILCNYEDHDYSPRWNYGDCFLLNPVTNQTIQLPGLKDEYGHLCDCVLSSPPHEPITANTTNPGNDSMVIFCYAEYYEEENNSHAYRILFCRPGETQWRIHKLSTDIVDFISERDPAIICFNGKLYLMCTDIDNQDDHLDHCLEMECTTDLNLSIKSLHVKKCASFRLVFPNTVHYVESHDELFRVIIFRGKPLSHVISIHVARLNFLSMEWEKVNSFGDHVLFVSYQNTSTGYCSAAELGFTSGCLYYLPSFGESLHKFEIQTTCDTITLPCQWTTEIFGFTGWVIMPVYLQGRMESMLRKDEENGFLTALEIKKTSSSMAVNDENLGVNCNEGEVEVVSHWNNFNEDIVVEISNHLHGSDYKFFRSMCKGNRAIIPKVQPTSYLSPWLVFSRDHEFTIYNVVNPMYSNENYTINFHNLQGCTICFQKGGWLLMMRNECTFFYNPLTRDTVKLPDMDLGKYSFVSFSSLPTSSDCIVFAMAHRKDGIYINCIRKGEAHWSCLIFHNTNFERRSMPFLSTAVFLDGAFFCLDDHGTVGRFSTKENNWKVVKEPDEEFYQGYLLECFGALLLVQLQQCGMPVKISKLNFSEMEWVEVQNLGDHMLFIGDTSCASAVAPKNNMKNKIYFPRLHVSGGGIVYYSLETGRYHSLGRQDFSGDLYNTQGWLSNCTWIEPNRLEPTSQELDWLKTP